MHIFEVSDIELRWIGQAVIERIVEQQKLVLRLEKAGAVREMVNVAEKELEEIVLMAVRVFPDGIEGYDLDISIEMPGTEGQIH